ncbi:hypothetical protein G9A89_002121 [Geosiphon pyriformis]|nr:hypothetical protein G9A89_002121 [Geosiphon pyriformis]
MAALRSRYPSIAELFDYNRSGTVAYLKVTGALSGYHFNYEFNVPHTGHDDGVKVWKQYHDKIEAYVEELCAKLKSRDRGDFREVLRDARKDLANHVHEKYYQKLPYWPSVGGRNVERIQLNTYGSYQSGSFYVVWACLGWVTVTDERPDRSTYKVNFRGDPEIKLLLIDFDILGALEKTVASRIDEAKRLIDSKPQEYRALTWELLTLVIV